MRAVSRCLFSDRLRTALLDFATRIVRSIDTSISCTLSASVPSALPARSPEPGAANNIFQYTERRGGEDRYLSLYARACALSHASNLCRSSASWETSGQRTAQSTRAPARCASHAKPATSSTRRGLATSMLPRMCSVSAGSAQCLRLPTPAPLRLLSCTRMAVTTWKHRTIERGAEALHSRLRATTPALVLRGQLSNSPTPRTPQCRYHLPRALPLQGASASLGDSRGP